MRAKTKWLIAIAVVPALLCLLGYWAFDWVRFINVRILIVLFWAAILGSLIALASIRRNYLSPLGIALTSWLLLLPAAEATLAWSAWTLNGFGP